MRPVYALGVFIPVAIVLELTHASPILIFSAAALGVIPTAAVMGEATEHLAAQTGPGIGGFRNVIFGNAPRTTTSTAECLVISGRCYAAARAGPATPGAAPPGPSRAPRPAGEPACHRDEPRRFPGNVGARNS